MRTQKVHNNTLSRGQQRPQLPVYYYHTNFCDLLGFVESRYDHVLEAHHTAFLAAFRALPKNAQYLYVRIAGRKGDVCDTRKLNYAEINDIPNALAVLAREEFIHPPQKDALDATLSCMTKPELIAFLRKHLDRSRFKGSWQKDALIKTARDHLNPAHITWPEHIIAQGFYETLSYISFLYFGRIEETLQKFTLRDLGLFKAPDFKADYSARFDEQTEAQSAFFFATALHKFRHGNDRDADHLIDTVDRWPPALCNYSVNVRDKLLQKLGGRSERASDIETAITLYARSTAPLCTERLIRLRYTRNDDDQQDRMWVKSRLEAMIDNPSTDVESYFASDFYNRKYKKKRTSLVTDMLRGGDVIKIDEAFRHEPERAACRYYRAKGMTAIRTENALWKMLFGLLFWDILFGPQSTGLHNSFERMPSVLKSAQFYDLFKQTIEDKLATLDNPAAVKLSLLKTVTQNHGTANGIFRWRKRTLGKLQTFLDVAQPGAVRHMLRLMAKDYQNLKDGFPDLMIVDRDGVKFTEIKSEGDIIRRNQMTRLKQLRDAGFRADIARIEWIVDPNQTYVVVDVETTGGRPPNHRVTEIGAVKVRGGKVIDSWQSLINPDRSIPPKITRLTGITHDMVKTAPRFRDIAEDFKAFMGDAIFAAHNVNFDYGFMRSEYKRLNQSFHHAKLCTVASMRKYHPGHRSYSLKNLCAAYDIDLTSHHRALCDAKAASALLHLINDKRLAD